MVGLPAQGPAKIGAADGDLVELGNLGPGENLVKVPAGDFGFYVDLLADKSVDFLPQLLLEALDELLQGISGFDHGPDHRPAADVDHGPHVLPGLRPADLGLDRKNVVEQPVDRPDLVVAHPGVLGRYLEGCRSAFLSK